MALSSSPKDRRTPSSRKAGRGGPAPDAASLSDNNRTSFRFQPEPIEQLATDATARFAATPLNSHPPSSPIDVPKPAAPHLGGGRLIWLYRRRAWARTRPPSNQHVTAQFGSSIGRGHLRRGPPSNRSNNSNRGRWDAIGKVIQETNVPAGREGVALSPSHGRLPAKHSKLAKLCQRNAWLRRRFCLLACLLGRWHMLCVCAAAAVPRSPGPLTAQLPA